ncbi:hypothetical protein [Burkholderia gladioli]|uniref:hypothetical protein n=1 Tax=Burkholderia gladioli TaxID=28095 RepID=UPI00163F31B7|nr:hypothetical protein [Burkholderia gladioli]
MGEIADDHLDRMFDRMFDDEDSFFGRRPRRGSGFDRTCERCGKYGLKWRADADGWRLYENERVEHNRLKRHECNPPSEDDFDVIG